MYKPSTGSAYLYVPVTAPDGVDPATMTASIALIPEAAGGEPAATDYKAATWVGEEAVLLLTEGMYPDGEYAVWLRIQAAPEDLRLPAGRCRIGDTRT